jgi:hypothetical protein
MLGLAKWLIVLCPAPHTVHWCPCKDRRSRNNLEEYKGKHAEICSALQHLDVRVPGLWRSAISMNKGKRGGRDRGRACTNHGASPPVSQTGRRHDACTGIFLCLSDRAMSQSASVCWCTRRRLLKILHRLHSTTVAEPATIQRGLNEQWVKMVGSHLVKSDLRKTMRIVWKRWPPGRLYSNRHG